LDDLPPRFWLRSKASIGFPGPEGERSRTVVLDPDEDSPAKTVGGDTPAAARVPGAGGDVVSLAAFVRQHDSPPFSCT
jgi:hypothetical protein